MKNITKNTRASQTPLNGIFTGFFLLYLLLTSTSPTGSCSRLQIQKCLCRRSCQGKLGTGPGLLVRPYAFLPGSKVREAVFVPGFATSISTQLRCSAGRRPKAVCCPSSAALLSEPSQWKGECAPNSA